MNREVTMISFNGEKILLDLPVLVIDGRIPIMIRSSS